MLRNIYMSAILAAVILFKLPCAEMAPTTYGPTGLIDIPTSDIVRTDQMEVGYYSLDKKNYEVFALPLTKNIEISGSLRNEDKEHTLKTLNAKVNIRQEKILNPGIALGVYDMANNDKRSVYISASKAVPFGLRLTAGVGTNYYKDGFVGVETRLIPLSKGGSFPDMSLMIEHIDKKTSYGLRMATARGLQITAGWRDKEPFWGITYTVP
ncbi:YjbH domain-containing protein [Pectinatus haikarae]|uniref:Exopolysaccharide biosynthesis protein YbjH n=1 Tax=Pectinatus haikarae TaxID=349096 RepID=A0ABT9Y7G2_9FIRM|nr:YjbH domain-containing protein [Pectinatus haikarae]MDQ0203084.1 hypothetical protein [Pectinatus haikarae]